MDEKVNLTVDSQHQGHRLDVYVTQLLSHKIPSRSFVRKLIDDGLITVNGRTYKANHHVSKDDQIEILFPDNRLAPQTLEGDKIDLDVIYEDPYILVINKPSGLLVHPAPGIYRNTLINALIDRGTPLSDVQNDTFRPGIVHRLDQETSGVMMVVKNNDIHIFLAKQFAKHKVFKRYTALVEGRVEFDEGRIDAPLARSPKHRDQRSVQFSDKAKEALTDYRVRKRFEKTSRVDLYPKTGRTHQLRVHLRHLGHPILGDVKYGSQKTFQRLALHAKSIKFYYPPFKKEVEFSAQTPKEIKDYGY